MPAVEKRTISLPPAQASYIDSLVATGTYASASEVVERWLRDEVVPVHDAMQADPGRGFSGDQVMAAMRAHHGDNRGCPAGPSSGADRGCPAYV